MYTSLTTEVIGGVTSVFETAFTGAKSVASVASGGVYSDYAQVFLSLNLMN